MNLKFAKLYLDAKAPERANPSDAGADLFYCGPDVFIHPGQSKVLSTGLKFEIPNGYMLEIKNRSSVASKKQLLVGACVCDAGYAGEVFVNLHNTGVAAQAINRGDKIAQAVLVPVMTPTFSEIPEQELYKAVQVNSNRGAGGFGSTGQ